MHSVIVRPPIGGSQLPFVCTAPTPPGVAALNSEGGHPCRCGGAIHRSTLARFSSIHLEACAGV